MNETIKEFKELCEEIASHTKRTDKAAILTKLKDRTDLRLLFRFATQQHEVFCHDLSDKPQTSKTSWHETLEHLWASFCLHIPDPELLKTSPFPGGFRFFGQSLNIGVGPALLAPYIELPKGYLRESERIKPDRELIGDGNQFTWIHSHLPKQENGSDHSWYCYPVGGIKIRYTETGLQVQGGKRFKLEEAWEKVRSFSFNIPHLEDKTAQILIYGADKRLLSHADSFERMFGSGQLSDKEYVQVDAFSIRWPLAHDEKSLVAHAKYAKAQGFTRLHITTVTPSTHLYGLEL